MNWPGKGTLVGSKPLVAGKRAKELVVKELAIKDLGRFFRNFWIFLIFAQSNPASALEPVAQAPCVSLSVKDARREVIKGGNLFLVLDQAGAIPPVNESGFGLYQDDTRYLSGWQWQLDGEPLVPLYVSTEEGFAEHFVYSNKACPALGLPEQKLVVERDLVITDAVYEKLTVRNCDTVSRDLNLRLDIGSDFADMFEVRGWERKERGKFLPYSSGAGSVRLHYLGRDGKARSTFVQVKAPTAIIEPASGFLPSMKLKLSLAPQEAALIESRLSTAIGPVDAASLKAFDRFSFDEQMKLALSGYEKWSRAGVQIVSDNPSLNAILARSQRDIYMLRQATGRGACIAAGIPWHAVAFGRDQAVTALELLPFRPALCREVIDVLSAYQGKKTDNYTEEKPGRIMHELRTGDMAANHEIAFTPYYGTVDATALYLILLGEYVNVTGDLEHIKAYWGNIEAALNYLQEESRGGYLVYGGKAGAALSNQGWKDSGDSIMYKDGKLARPPIALCEVQGYYYLALQNTARLALLLGHTERSQELLARAARLKQNFNRDFLTGDFVALALDGEGKRCEVVSSNVGHVLFSGLLDSKKARQCGQRLLSKDVFSGWGIRTLSANEAAYNPVSYHNGSVWPHDNALCASGLAASGDTAGAARVTTALLEAASGFDDRRLPELFSGFARQGKDRPVSYPVSCSPQAWAAGSMYMLLSSSLGLKFEAPAHRLTVASPKLPGGVNHLTLEKLAVGKALVSLAFDRKGSATVCRVLKKSGALTVRILP